MFMALKNQIKYMQICLRHNMNEHMPSYQLNIDIIKYVEKIILFIQNRLNTFHM